MTTIINTPAPVESSDSGVGIVLGVIVAIVLITLFFVFALPAIRGTTPPQGSTTDININLPTKTTPPASAPAY